MRRLKYAPLDQITRENVRELGVAWMWDSPDNAVVTTNRRALPSFPRRSRPIPIMVDGVSTSRRLSAGIGQDAATGRRYGPSIRNLAAWAAANRVQLAWGRYWSDGKSARIFLPTGNRASLGARCEKRPAD
jgi:quinoprotein glucose dehydrogenase